MQHTRAGDPSVLVVATVVLAPAQAFAFTQVLFCAIAVDIIQQNQAGAVAKVGVGVCIDCSAAAYLLAHHPGIVEDPVIITHCPPASLVVDLYTALAGVLSIHQTDGAISYIKREREGEEFKETDSIFADSVGFYYHLYSHRI